MSIRDELNTKIQTLGVKDIKPYWDPEWVDRIRSMPNGLEKEAEKEKALQTIKTMLEAVERGEYAVVDLIDEVLTK